MSETLPSIMNFTLQELQENVSPKFRAAQIFSWMYLKKEFNFSKMSNIPKDMQNELASRFSTNPLRIISKQKSVDGTVKYLFELRDGHTVESVLLLMSEEERGDDEEIQKQANYTICLSTQVGCKIGCSFCLTAKGGFIRNLEACEIAAQVVVIAKDISLPENKSLNLVYMGMGEPLDNFDALVKGIGILSDPKGLNINPKRHTVSTSGIAGKIEKLASLDLGINLAISLHAVDDVLREKLIPINKAYNIRAILDAVRTFPVNRRKKILFEYILLGGVNDDLESAKKLVRLLNGIDAKVNLIPFNPFEGSEFKRPGVDSCVSFRDYLKQKGVIATIRTPRGDDISAACGQLREQYMQGMGA